MPVASSQASRDWPRAGNCNHRRPTPGAVLNDERPRLVGGCGGLHLARRVQRLCPPGCRRPEASMSSQRGTAGAFLPERGPYRRTRHHTAPPPRTWARHHHSDPPPRSTPEHHLSHPARAGSARGGRRQPRALRPAHRGVSSGKTTIHHVRHHHRGDHAVSVAGQATSPHPGPAQRAPW